MVTPYSRRLIRPCVLLKFYKEPEHNMTILEKPDKVWIWTVRRGLPPADEMELPNPFTFAEWLKHLLYILNLSVPSQLSFLQNAELFDLGIVKSTFPKFNALRIGRVSAEHSENVFRTFLPDIKNLKISNPFNEGDCRFQRLLSQNFDSLVLEFFDNTRKFTLNDLLICNASFIEYRGREFKEVNQFLKLWIKGANPRLQELIIRQSTGFVPENIFEGVKIIRVIPVHEEIRHNGVLLVSGGLPDRFAVDIKRFDGLNEYIIVLVTVVNVALGSPECYMHQLIHVLCPSHNKKWLIYLLQALTAGYYDILYLEERTFLMLFINLYVIYGVHGCFVFCIPVLQEILMHWTSF
ncbi:hypothetical protein CAEBREN_10452 [Caenorhabditis brenneri]|uniref:Sdz-33 F-box domain-containing protein n=1 Tax=Caenorhabditis brenneri TaxID=135651 RepID=G0NST3_CAEBE|nr:hypothetical protein CAEBREN_10452 [Caenorhabditis brenneri]